VPFLHGVRKALRCCALEAPRQRGASSTQHALHAERLFAFFAYRRCPMWDSPSSSAEQRRQVRSPRRGRRALFELRLFAALCEQKGRVAQPPGLPSSAEHRRRRRGCGGRFLGDFFVDTKKLPARRGGTRPTLARTGNASHITTLCQRTPARAKHRAQRRPPTTATHSTQHVSARRAAPPSPPPPNASPHSLPADRNTARYAAAVPSTRPPSPHC
jgi:hypothetical protein